MTIFFQNQDTTRGTQPNLIGKSLQSWESSAWQDDSG